MQFAQRMSRDLSTDDTNDDVKYLCVKLGISTVLINERPAIGSLIKSVLPSANWVEHWMEHYFILPKDRYSANIYLLTYFMHFTWP